MNSSSIVGILGDVILHNPQPDAVEEQVFGTSTVDGARPTLENGGHVWEWSALVLRQLVDMRRIASHHLFQRGLDSTSLSITSAGGVLRATPLSPQELPQRPQQSACSNGRRRPPRWRMSRMRRIHKRCHARMISSGLGSAIFSSVGLPPISRTGLACSYSIACLRHCALTANGGRRRVAVEPANEEESCCACVATPGDVKGASAVPASLSRPVPLPRFPRIDAGVRGVWHGPVEAFCNASSPIPSHAPCQLPPSSPASRAVLAL
jgi:hypothetical protein